VAIALQLPDRGARRVHLQHHRHATSIAHPIGAGRCHARRDRRQAVPAPPSATRSVAAAVTGYYQAIVSRNDRKALGYLVPGYR
jgi:hypothetical protein